MSGYIKRLVAVYDDQGPWQLVKSIVYFIIIRTLIPDRAKFHWGNRLRYAKNRMKYENVAPPMKVLEIEPGRIERYLGGMKYNQNFGLGYIESGDWDQSNPRVTDHFIHRGLEERFTERVDWDDTEYVGVAAENIRERGYFWGYHSVSEFKRQRCRFVEDLYEDMRVDGFKSARDTGHIDERRHDNNYYQSVIEITVGIGRDGEILLYDGLHRFTIAKLLNIEKIPVMVIVRHRQWQDVRDRANRHGEDVCPEGHPDLEDI